MDGHGNNENIDIAEELKSLYDIPVPDPIVFYSRGIKKVYNKESNEFDKILMLNTKRDDKNLSAMKLLIFIDELLNNYDMLEYNYGVNGSIYFNLFSNNHLKNNAIDVNWVLVRYNQTVFKSFCYCGLLSADELINYLYSLL